MNREGWEVPLPDDAAKILRDLKDQHGPAKYDWWCRCGQLKQLCGREREYGVQLTIAGLEWRPPPWAIQEEPPGRLLP